MHGGGFMADRKAVLKVLSKLNPGQFEFLLEMIEAQNAFLPGNNAAPAERAMALVRWAEGPSGCGFEALVVEMIDQSFFKAEEKEKVEDEKPAPRGESGLFLVPDGTPRFFGRTEQLAELDRFFSSGDPRRKAAVWGMGGVGKTQIAIYYAHARRESYHYIFFIPSDDALLLDNHFSAICRKLELPVSKNLEAKPDDFRFALRDWMTKTDGWLAIFDNADDLDIFKPYLPETVAGHVLLTTRDTTAEDFAFSIPLKVFTEEQSAEFLFENTGRRDEDASRKLAREMGGLPLALDQAVAFISELKSSPAEYLECYREEGPELRDRRGDEVAGHASVAKTFGVAFRNLVEKHPATADILRVCAFCAPDEIPEEIFRSSNGILGENIAGVAGSTLKWLKALEPATRFSLLTRDADNKMIGLHRVVQEVIRDEMAEAEQKRWSEQLIRAMNEVFPRLEFENWSACLRLIPQAKESVELIERFGIETDFAARLLNRAGQLLWELGRYAEAEPLYECALGINERALGEEHPDTAQSLNNLAGLYESQGRYTKAEPLYERALGIRERALGAEHPSTATSLNNLALLYRSQGRYAEAEPLQKRDLEITERALGGEHPDTATSLNNLAGLYRSQDRYGEAEPLYERALGIYERALGAEHPDTATSLNNLAGLYRSQDRYGEAEPLYERALGIRERALGAEHPDTATSVNNLALLYVSQGLYTKAEPLFERALGIRERALGGEHPDTATSLNNLAGLYKSQGRYAEAEPLYERALGITKRVLGDEHPNTQTVAKNLEALRCEMNGETTG